MDESGEIDENYPSPGSSSNKRTIHFAVNKDVSPDPFEHLSSSEISYKPLRIERPVVHQLDLYSKFYNVNPSDDPEVGCCSSVTKKFRRIGSHCKDWQPVRWIKSTVPILEWMPNYKWKEDFLADLIAGFTVAVMHVPQGMAYALLAEVPPIVGIYMAFFPIFIYAVMGTSRHVSMGTFAVICLMTGKIVLHVMEKYPSEYNAVAIATVVSFVVGISQIIMGILRLGAVSLLLSPSLVGGFTTGAAVHVLTSQVQNFFGLQLPKHSGLFKIPQTYYDIAKHITETNVATVIVASTTIVTLTFYNELIKPHISKRTKIPIPVELLAVITGTLVSHYMDIHTTYEVSVIGDIPTGLPEPELPPLEIVPDILMDSVVIAFVSYAISISMAKIFAKRLKYTVDANQELIAQGSSNVFGSFFSCAPVAVSLSRSLVQETVGGKTQLTSIFSCLFLVCVLLWIGPLFETLPNAVLAGIIIVALKGMFMQATEFPRYWRMSALHGTLWMASFLGCVILDIPYGLGIGMLLSTVILLWRSNKSEISILGSYAHSDLYIDINGNNDHVQQLPGIKIIKYTGTLNFATIEKFIENVMRIVDVNSNVEKTSRKNKSKLRKAASMSSTLAIVTASATDISSDDEDYTNIRWVILDLSSASSVGPGSVTALSQLHSSFEKEGIDIFYAGCPVTVIKEMDTCGFFRKLGRRVLFPTIHDAVLACQKNNTDKDAKTPGSNEV